MGIRKIILASSSGYRRAQLETLKLSFEQMSPSVSEAHLEGENAPTLAARLAELKARSVAKAASGLVIGCDQTAELGTQILGKPHTMTNAVQQLTDCSGKTVTFYSALCLYNSDTQNCQVETVKTQVTFKVLSSSQINYYLQQDMPLNCAGSFKSEALGIALFESVTSDDPTALVGLPLICLSRFLYNEGVDILRAN